MTQKWTGFIFCVALGVVLTAILFVESKRPIHVHITAEEITGGLCAEDNN
jgi:hypothetical protein